MKVRRSRRLTAIVAIALTTTLGLAACRGSAPQPGPTGAADTQSASKADITIGGSFPFSGPLAVFGSLSAGLNSYLGMINDQGGVNGRKIIYTPIDDGYDPSRLASNARKLVEQDKVLALVSFGGTNLTIRDYMKSRGVPQFVMAGNSPLSDIKTYPTTRAWWPDIHLEGAITARVVLSKNAGAKVGTLALNNDLSKSLIEGVKGGLGAKANQLISEQTFEPGQTDLSGQINNLKAAGVDTVIGGVSGTQGSSALKYMSQIGYTPTFFNYSNSASRLAFADPAGPAAVGVYTVQWLKDPADPQWANEAWLNKYKDAVSKYGNGAKSDDLSVLNGYAFGEALVKALSGMSKPTQEGLLEAWGKIKDQTSDALVPGVKLSIGPDGRLIHSYSLARYDGKSWVLQGKVIDAMAEGLMDVR